MQKLIIASHNKGKIAEFKEIMANWPIKPVGLSEVGINCEIAETGSTFFQNALIKAEFAHQLTKLKVLADDGGIEIDALNGQPGVKSRRWKGYEMSDQELIDYTLEQLHSVPLEKRTCRLIAVICYIDESGIPLFVTSSIEGIITEKQETSIIPGYPFRSIMRLTNGKMYSELTEKEHKKISHRRLALEKLASQISW